MSITPKPIESKLSSLLIDSSRPHKRLLQNQKRGGSRELFLPGNDFQTSSTVNIPKNIQILETWKSTEGIKSRLDFFHITYMSTQYSIKIVLGT